MRYIFFILIACFSLNNSFGQGCFNAGDGSDGAYIATANTTLAGGEYHYTSFYIAPGVTVTGSGNTPLVIRVTENVTIEGTLTVNGGNGAPGVLNVTYGGGGIGIAGGSNGGNGSYSNNNLPPPANFGFGIGGGGNGQEYGGGGGGGYGSNGTASGNSFGGGAGLTYGSAEISELYGGSGGGGGGGGLGNGGGGGGAGGGAIEISCGGTLTITSSGVINSNGGNGGNSGTHVGGGGGGSGGSILLKSVELVNNGLITAVGGTGGFSQSPASGRIGGNGGNGRIAIQHELPISGNGTFTPLYGSDQSLAIAPQVQAFASPSAELCEGAEVTLTAQGDASSVVWSNNVSDGVAFVPLTGGWYVVTASTGSECFAIDSVLITVVTNPPLNPFAIPGTSICLGESITLSGGADAAVFTWSGGVEDGVAFVPTISDVYEVLATNGSGCVSTASISITVNPNPTVELGTNFETTSFPVILNAGSGFSSYLWNTEEETQIISVNSSGIYSVIVTNESGCSATDSIEVNQVTGVDQVAQNVISVFPNPASGQIRVNNNQLIQSLRIINISGLVVSEIFQPQNTLNIEELAPGLYFMEILTNNEMHNIRLIKQ